MKKLIDGKNDKCSNEDYHADREYTSSSGVKMVLKDELEYLKKYVLNIKEEGVNLNFIFGTYMHTAVLEPELLEEECAVYTGATRSGKVWKQFEEENAHKTIITRPQKLLHDKLMAKYDKHHYAKELFTGGEAEVTYAGELMGFKVKCRADYIKDNALIDLKTTGKELSYASIQSTIHSFGYDISAAFYLDIINQYREQPLNEMIFVFMSKATHDVMVVKLGADYIDAGRQKYIAAINKYNKLKAEGYFTTTLEDIDNMVMTVGLPEWAK